MIQGSCVVTASTGLILEGEKGGIEVNLGQKETFGDKYLLCCIFEEKTLCLNLTRLMMCSRTTTDQTQKNVF